MLTRRQAVSLLSVGILRLLPALVATSSKALASVNSLCNSCGTDEVSMEAWLEDAILTRSLIGPLRLGRFVEPIYFLTEPTTWTQSTTTTKLQKLPSVSVPVGFVTDMASIPRVFFSLLRPDGDYAHAAIVHDYLYWNQEVDRTTADRIFKLAMEDLEVSPFIVEVILLAVNLRGKSAWEENADLRRNGERRLLKNFPTESKTRWSEWKKNLSNFY
jgi:hypothetical protein